MKKYINLTKRAMNLRYSGGIVSLSAGINHLPEEIGNLFPNILEAVEEKKEIILEVEEVVEEVVEKEVVEETEENVDLNKMKKADIVEYAAKLGIELDPMMKKADMISAIQ